MRFVSTLMLCAIVPAALLAQPAAADRGRAYLNENRGRLGLGQDHEFRFRKANVAANQSSHVRFDQYFKGVKVFEGEGIVHFEANGATTLTDAFRRLSGLDVNPAIGEGAARLAALRAAGVLNPSDLQIALEILPRGERSLTDRLVYHVKLYVEADGVDPIQKEVFVDAKNGQIAWMFDALETAATTVTGGGHTMYIGQVNLLEDLNAGTYSLVSPTQANLATKDMKNRQVGSGTNFSNTTGIFGDYSINNTDRGTAGADGHFGMTQTWAYFKDTFGRNGINNAGKSSYGRVHYGKNYQNAYWNDSCFCMTYGDGGSTFLPLVSIDVTGHEMAHGVMASEAALTYSGESGGLNESSSDIFGTLVEFYTNSSVDVPEYWIGERIYKSNWSGGTYVETKALRYMDQPNKDGISPNCWSSTIGSLDVHYSSGPNNHFFYLLAHGGTSKCNSTVVSGIGNAKAAQIWYDAISNRMTSSTNYAGARAACLQSAAALFGTGSVEYNAVAAAYSGINVN